MRHGRGNPRNCRWGGFAWLAIGGLLLAGGCTRVPRPSFSTGWNPVPSLSWRSANDAAAPKPTPTVSANAGSVDNPPASQIAAADDPGHDELIGNDAASPVTGDLRVDPFLDEAQAIAQTSDSRVQRLRQALSADARRAEEPAPSDDEQSPLRLRIDALLRKSAQQRDDGQLADAHSTAQRATELAEEAQISFLPTELRPSDLLRQLTDALDRSATETSTTPVATVDSSLLTPTSDTTASPSLALPVIDSTDVTAVPWGRRRVEVEPRVSGQVAANRPMQLSSRDTAVDETNTPAVATIDLPEAMDDDGDDGPSGEMRSATRDLLMSRTAATGPELRLPDQAPEPVSIDPLKPLPKFRSSHRAAKPVELTPLEAIPMPGVGMRGWSLWGPVLSLTAIAAVVGLGLLSRTFWFWRLLPRGNGQ